MRYGSSCSSRQYNVPDDVYKILSPKIALWPTPTWLWSNYGTDGINTGTYTTYHTKEIMEELHAKNIVLKEETIIEF